MQQALNFDLPEQPTPVLLRGISGTLFGQN